MSSHWFEGANNFSMPYATFTVPAAGANTAASPQAQDVGSRQRLGHPSWSQEDDGGHFHSTHRGHSRTSLPARVPTHNQIQDTLYHPQIEARRAGTLDHHQQHRPPPLAYPTNTQQYPVRRAGTVDHQQQHLPPPQTYLANAQQYPTEEPNEHTWTGSYNQPQYAHGDQQVQVRQQQKISPPRPVQRKRQEVHDEAYSAEDQGDPPPPYSAPSSFPVPHTSPPAHSSSGSSQPHHAPSPLPFVASPQSAPARPYANDHGWVKHPPQEAVRPIRQGSTNGTTHTRKESVAFPIPFVASPHGSMDFQPAAQGSSFDNASYTGAGSAPANTNYTGTGYPSGQRQSYGRYPRPRPPNPFRSIQVTNHDPNVSPEAHRYTTDLTYGGAGYAASRPFCNVGPISEEPSSYAMPESPQRAPDRRSTNPFLPLLAAERQRVTHERRFTSSVQSN